MSPTIEFRCFQIEFLSDAVHLLQYLWGNDDSQNRDYFKWKYLDNPYSEFPMGVVASDNGKIVGFRGYFATMWQFGPDAKIFKILCPGDTCIHPDYRRQGLSVALGDLALKEFSSECEIFFNWSSSKNSYPGYLKMGFIPLAMAEKIFMTRGGLLPIMRFLIDAKRGGKLSPQNISFGQFDSIMVSSSPLPSEMHEVLQSQDADEYRFRIVKNLEFLKWRFSNGRYRYIFYILKRNGLPAGYVVIRVSKSNTRGFIMDYEENCQGVVESILKFMIKAKHFKLLSVSSYAIRGDFYRTFRALGFKLNSPLRIAEKKVWGEVPLLIRPAKTEYDEKDFLLFGHDIRKYANWRLEEICSDGT